MNNYMMATEEINAYRQLVSNMLMDMIANFFVSFLSY
jgi:hypothetical protein